MDSSSSFVKPESPAGIPLDLQGFKNILDALKKSKQQQKIKATPSLETEQ